jgi:hypothetical protein
MKKLILVVMTVAVLIIPLSSVSSAGTFTLEKVAHGTSGSTYGPPPASLYGTNGIKIVQPGDGTIFTTTQYQGMNYADPCLISMSTEKIVWHPYSYAGNLSNIQSNGVTAPTTFHNEMMQSFTAFEDANMGSFAFELRHNTSSVVQRAAGTTLVVSLYALKNHGDQTPNNEDLLMQWKGQIPAGFDTDVNNPATPQRGDWLKFTFTPAYHLQNLSTYGIRLGWESPQALANPPSATDPNQRWIMWMCCSSSGQIGTYNGIKCYGNYPYGDACRLQDFASGSTTVNYPWWVSFNRDMNFSVLKPAAGVKAVVGKVPGDSSFDGQVNLTDFAAEAAKWGENKRTVQSDTSITYKIHHLAPAYPTNEVLLINDQPATPEPNNTPYTDWTYKIVYDPDPNLKSHQLGQSFKATSTAVMHGIALQLATATSPVSGDTSGWYTVSVYEVADDNTPPNSGTLLNSYHGYFVREEDNPVLTNYPYGYWNPTYNSGYATLTRQISARGEWFTFVLPSGVNLTANNYYAFALTWDASEDPLQYDNFGNRKFLVDCSDVNGPDVYADGRAWYRPSDTNPNWYNIASNVNDKGRDLDFAILGSEYVCQWGTASILPGGAAAFRTSEADLNMDCIVDMKDMDVLADHWLNASLQ